MSIILIIDSSLTNASVSVAKDGIILQQLENNIQKNHAAFIHLAIKELVNDFTILDAIACTIGPGSYTGIRVGLSAAKGFSYALQKPLITMTTLEAMAKTLTIKYNTNENYCICPMIDARRMEVFTALYNEKLEELLPAQAMVLNIDSFKNFENKNPIYFIGDAVEKWKNICELKNAFFENQYAIKEAISIIAYQKYINKNFTSASTSVPLYTKEFYNQ